MSLHKLLEIVLILSIAIAFTGLVRIRPNATPMSRNKWVGLFVLGLIIGVIFLTTDNYYVQSAGL